MENGLFKRVLKSKDVVALAFGSMIGWGWVVMTGNWLQTAGSLGAIGAFLIGGAAVVLIGLTYAELAAAMPLTGGEHIYSYRALGTGGSFFCTWAILLGYVSVVAFEAVALPTVIEHLFPSYPRGYLWTVAGWDVYLSWVLVGAAGALGMMWVNIRGISASAFMQQTITLMVLLVGALLLSGALFTGSSDNMQPIFANGHKGLLAVLIMTPFMFVGFDVIPQAAEEIDLPHQQIGRLLVVSVLMAVLWYTAMIFSVALLLDPAETAASPLATADAMSSAYDSHWGGKILVIAGIGGIITSWNAFLIGGSRALFAMARAKMLPAFLGRLHPQHRTPVNAILMLGGLSLLAPLFGRPALVWLVDAGGLGIVLAYGTVALSFLILRRREPAMHRPFRVTRGPVIGTAALLLSLAMTTLYLPGSPAALIWPYEWLIVLLWVLLGVVFYLWSRVSFGAASAAIMSKELKQLTAGQGNAAGKQGPRRLI
ncbi:MAG: APC family permease [Congregibacter sp.]|nr:APC family permease [Congregibacter sp.]